MTAASPLTMLKLLRALTKGDPPGAPGRFGKYEVVERIGGGAFGSVYRGRDPVLQRDVAIKTCDAAGADFRSRFFREAKLVARLRHPHIVTIYDFDGESDVPYIVEELLDGQDLNRLISEGEPRALAEKLRILEGVACGLAHAHAEGVVHRDVKPANIRVMRDGTSKIFDFGIAKALDGESTMTRPGIALGSAGYMSPEQIEGRALDHRTDIFSLGVVAYEMFAGQRPFYAPTLPKLFRKIVSDEPEPLRARNPEVPPALESLIHSAMSKDPENRPGGAEPVRAELERIRSDAAATA